MASQDSTMRAGGVGTDLTSALRAARGIEAGDSADLATARLVMLATFTADPLRPHILAAGATRGFHIETKFAPFNQLELQVFDAGSPLYADSTDVIMLAARLEELSPRLAFRFASLSPEAVADEIKTVSARLRSLGHAIRERSRAPLLLWNVARPRVLAAGIADAGLRPSQASAVEQINSSLAEAVAEVTDCHLVDYAGLVAERGIMRMTDQRMWLRARLPFGAEGMAAVAGLVARCVAATRRPARKCLVLDLDNTLWGGVLGEDGVAGIRIGSDHPGTVFRAFQEYVVSLRDRGILLAIASKNDRDEALSVLESHADCVLRPAMFSAIEISWVDKASSLRAIARDLSIGLDSLVFFDDSAVEREWVRTQLPEVLVLDVPADPTGYVDTLAHSEAFDTLTISREDSGRAEMYAQEAQRRELQGTGQSLDTFIRDLEICVQMGAVGPATLPRVAQLVGKTNQFNTTTRRHTQADLERMLGGGAVGLWARVSDRFGDSGLVGVAFAVPGDSPDIWRIDVFLLSCRVIGRGIESTLLRELAARVRRLGGRRLVGELVRTTRNEPAERLFRAHGFTSLDDEGRFWEYDLAQGGPDASPDIRCEVMD